MSAPAPAYRTGRRIALERPVLDTALLSSDDEIGATVAEILGSCPATLPSDSRPLPLLRALRRRDAEERMHRARALSIVAAAVHHSADERYVAEYLLRHRNELADGRRSGTALVRAARCVAAMEARAQSLLEMPVEGGAFPAAGLADENLSEAPSVGDIVIGFISDAVAAVDAKTEDHIRNAVAITVDLAERHRRKGGSGPSVIAMRPAARRQARLVTRLFREVPDRRVARAIARLLLGGDGTPLETSLLWWVAQGARASRPVPEATLKRWRRDVALARGAGARSAA